MLCIHEFRPYHGIFVYNVLRSGFDSVSCQHIDCKNGNFQQKKKQKLIIKWEKDKPDHRSIVIGK
jgi:hypothetical protein